MKDLEILQGCLGDPLIGNRVGIIEGQFALVTGYGETYEVLVLNDDWDQFIESVSGYSDYIPGDN